MLIRPAIGDTDPIRYRRPTPDDQFSGNILDEAMRPIIREPNVTCRDLVLMASDYSGACEATQCH